MEIQKYQDKIAELEKWIMLLLNNFYSGNPAQLESIQKGLSDVDTLRNEKFALKKSILIEKKK